MYYENIVDVLKTNVYDKLNIHYKIIVKSVKC